MKDRYIAGFFNAISWVIWAATIAVLVFAVVLLCTGMEKPPQFGLNAVRLAPVAETDPVLAENGKNGADWFMLELDMTVSANRYSPFDYTAESFVLWAPADLRAGDWFTMIDAPLKYSKIAPDDFTLRLYLRAPAGEAALRARLPELGFRIRGLTGYFTFLKFPFRYDQPAFALSDFTLPAELAA